VTVVGGGRAREMRGGEREKRRVTKFSKFKLIFIIVIYKI
jgi:hypothetical protein